MIFVYNECIKGDPDAAKRRLEYIKDAIVLETTPDIEPLANIYIKLLNIPTRSLIDSMHLAICCINEIDILLSWNCVHLGAVSMQLIQKYNDLHGLFTPQMLTPDYIVEKYMEVDLNE